LPMLFLLGVCEVALRREMLWRQGLRIAGSLLLIALIGWAILWASYGFRYAARPDGLQMNPPLTEYVKGLKTHEAWPVSVMASWHILPESYLYGLADVRLTAMY